MAEGFRVTYATMSADNEDLHKGYDEGIEEAKAELGRFHPAIVNGEERKGEGSYQLHSPIDSNIILGSFAQASVDDVNDAIEAARAFSLEWDRMGWKTHVELIRRAADLISERA